MLLGVLCVIGKLAHAELCPPRLDRLVSGVLILARSSLAASRLQRHLKQNFLEKDYLARVKVGHGYSLGFSPPPSAISSRDSMHGEQDIML